MNMKKSMTLFLMGVGGTLLYQQIRNGNAKKCIMDMEKMLKDVLGNDGFDNTDYNNRRTEKNRRKNNYENKKKYK